MMSNVLHQKMAVTAAYIITELDQALTRDVGMVASGSGKVDAGTVMGKLDVGGKYVPLDPDADTGAQTAAAILYQGCDATDADARRVFTSRLTAVSEPQLIWPADITAEQKVAAISALAANFVICR